MYEKTTLNNGLRVITQTLPETRSICLNFFIGAGGRYEKLPQSGLSHFIEHLCFKGTKRYPTTQEISETIESVGGIINGATDREMTIYWTKVAQPHFERSLDLMVDILRNSRFDAADIEKERSVITEEISTALDSPHERVAMLIDEVQWPNQPLGMDVAGTKETVGNINRNDIIDYFGSQYVPGNTVISIAGNIEHARAVSMLKGSLGNWVDGTPQPWIKADDRQDKPRFATEHRNTEQVHICLSVQGYSNTHPDRYILDMINVLLGKGMSSRLFMNIREKLGVAYDVHSFATHFMDSGALTVYAGVDPKRTTIAIQALLNELRQFAQKPVPAKELTKAKELSKGRLLIRMEDTSNMAMWLGGQELLKNYIVTIDEVVAIIDAVTANDIQRVARNIFRSEKLNASIVGPVENSMKIEDILVF
ncbi:MAG: insulinase family protein [Chloroflexi bacterium]|nr:insulinase family protein [Chloroflexota bacterium]MBT7082330.1 insulinase family protein [Chloroflexota bacterium]MBT7290609.1 insulinase family protein [Chloroflexota bacterium]